MKPIWAYDNDTTIWSPEMWFTISQDLCFGQMGMGGQHQKTLRNRDPTPSSYTSQSLLGGCRHPFPQWAPWFRPPFATLTTAFSLGLLWSERSLHVKKKKKNPLASYSPKPQLRREKLVQSDFHSLNHPGLEQQNLRGFRWGSHQR